MVVRLASDTIRTLYAIQCVTKDVKHPTQFSYCKNVSQKVHNVEKFRYVSKKSSSNSIPYGRSPEEIEMQTQKEGESISSDTALVHKIHATDRPLRNNVQERAKCNELDDILAKWNVYKPKK